jgi:hypothetical protein
MQAGIASSPERFKESVDILGVDDGAAVRDGKVGVSTSLFDYDIHDTVVPVVADRVVDQIGSESPGKVPTAEGAGRCTGTLNTHTPIGRCRRLV